MQGSFADKIGNMTMKACQEDLGDISCSSLSLTITVE